ncbi:MAG: hypothetical protein CMI02_14900 [Oceanospirillaceae bacterium]|nr:hypothetical protein [Oceanospirillaceae bacterium]
MALRDGVVNLILRARNLISKPTEEATGSMSGLQAEADKLEETLDDLGRQERAIKGFDDTKKAAEAATAELGRTVTEYERLRTRGRQAGETQAEYSLAVKQARTAQSLANTEYRRAQRELGRHTQTLNRAGIETDDLAGAEQRVQRELEETRRELDRVNDETAKHAARLDAASKSGGRFSSAMGGLQTRLLGFVAGLGVLESLRRGFMAIVNTGGGLEDIRRRLDGVFGSVEAGGEALRIIDEIAERNAQGLDETAEAALRLKSFGIDPLNGALQSLIDVNARYGRGAQSLETVTTQLGQAWASGRLQLEELNSITDAGIPILRALEEVTGRAAGQIRDMASAGDLGRDTLRELIAELGEMAEGAGAGRIRTLNGLRSALRKEFRDFFREIGQAGVLDTIKVRLQDLLATMREAASDGSLTRWARDTSDSLRGMLEVFERVGAGFAIFWNGITAAFRTGAASLLATIGTVASGLSKLAGFAGADDLSRSIRQFADNAKGAAGELVDQIAQDGEDIQRHFRTAFRQSADEAEKSADRQKKAIDETAAAAVTAADREVAATLEMVARKRVLRLQEQQQAAETAAEITRISSEMAEAQATFSRARKRRMELDETSLKQATEERSEAQIQANQQVQESLDQLGLEYDKLSGVLERRAINNFQRIVEQIELSGQEAKVQSRIVAEAYTAAFDEIETRAGRLEAAEQLKQALTEGLITQKDYNAALKETGTQASETLERLQRAIQIYQETTALATNAEKEKAQAAKETGDALDDQAAAAEDAADSMDAASRRAVVAGAGLTEAAENIRQAFYRVSEEAGALYDNLLREQTQGLLSTRSYMQAVGDVASEVNDRVARAEQRYQRAMAAQNEDTGQFITLAKSAIASGKVLGEERLSGLRSALASAKAQMEGLADSARDTVQGLRDELLQLTGTEDEIQRRQYERRRADLRQQLNDASAAGAGDAVAQYREALRLNEQVYNARRDQQRNERLQREQSERERPTRKTEVELKAPSGESVTVETAEGDDARFLKILEEAGLRSASR